MSSSCACRLIDRGTRQDLTKAIALRRGLPRSFQPCDPAKLGRVVPQIALAAEGGIHGARSGRRLASHTPENARKPLVATFTKLDNP
jgi:hypothetical protein